MVLSCILDILNIPDIPNINDSPTIPKNSHHHLSLSSSLCFCKGMTLDVCPDIPEFSTFLSFLTFLKFPPLVIFPSSTKSARGCGSKKVWYFMSVLTFLKFLTFPTYLTFPKSPPFLKFPSSFKSPQACGSENVWHLVSVCLSWHSQHSGIPTIPEAIA